MALGLGLAGAVALGQGAGVAAADTGSPDRSASSSATDTSRSATRTATDKAGGDSAGTSATAAKNRKDAKGADRSQASDDSELRQSTARERRLERRAARNAHTAGASDPGNAEIRTSGRSIIVDKHVRHTRAAARTPDATTQATATTVDVAVARTTLAASTTTPQPATPARSSFMTMLAGIRREWDRKYNNATPTLGSQTVNVTLTDSADISDPIALGGQDADGDPLQYSVADKGARTGPKYGTVTIDQAAGTFTYNPDDNLTSSTITDTFTITVQDRGSHSHGFLSFLKPLSGHGATASFTVIVGAVNPAPVAVADNISGIKNSPVTGNVLANDLAGQGKTLTATLATKPSHGTLNFASDGSFTYTPDANFTGTETFTYTASDGVKTSLVAKVTINVAAIVDAKTPTIGVQGLSWWLGLSDADTTRALDMAQSAGVTSVRMDVSWYSMEWTEGDYYWSLMDPLVDKVLAHEMTVLGMLYDTPQWLSGSANPHTPPNPQKFAQFAALAAGRYAGKIDTWEIWNEQNIPRFWDKPDPAAYANLLKAVYPAIKAVNPRATVITGGLSPDGSGIDPVSYIKAMYKAGAGGYFDAISLHPYAFPNLPSINPVSAVHDVMVANGDGAKKIWLTEVGAPTGTSPFAMSEAAQAQSILTFINWAKTVDYIGPVYLYSLLDTGTDLSDPEDNFGLIRRDFTPKPAFGIWL